MSMNFSVRVASVVNGQDIILRDISPSASLIFTFKFNGTNKTATSNDCEYGLCNVTGLLINLEGKKGDVCLVDVIYRSKYFIVRD